ncbi:MAG: thioredoxin family protein [Cytophagales bacterium]|nr:thioredoxin family protein [Rhizobacter sp.]
MHGTTPAHPPLLVACLCAQWCSSCREYRSTFDQVAQAFPGMRFIWVDIEDEADLVDPVEVENFPTLLITDESGPRFFGPLTPHKETLVRLLRAQAEAPGAAPLADVDLQALARRLRHG